MEYNRIFLFLPPSLPLNIEFSWPDNFTWILQLSSFTFQSHCRCSNSWTHLLRPELFKQMVWSVPPMFPPSQPEMTEFSSYHEPELATCSARWRNILKLNLGSVRERTVLYEWWLSWALQKGVTAHTSLTEQIWINFPKLQSCKWLILSCSKINGSHIYSIKSNPSDTTFQGSLQSRSRLPPAHFLLLFLSLFPYLTSPS